MDYVPLTKATLEILRNEPDLMKRIIIRTKQETAGIVATAIRLGILTSDEYVSRYKGKYLDEFGMDSFAQYLSAVAYHRSKKPLELAVFVTLCAPLLKNRASIQQRFGVKIFSHEEFMTESKKTITTKRE